MIHDPTDDYNQTTTWQLLSDPENFDKTTAFKFWWNWNLLHTGNINN